MSRSTFKNTTEALYETGWYGGMPENAKAWGIIADGATDDAAEAFGVAVSVCESPIETLLLAGLLSVQYPHRKCRSPGVRMPDGTAINANAPIQIFPQMRLGRYRLDFMVVAERKGEAPTMVNVECDGHEFHQDVTMVQWNADRDRDAYVRSLGHMVKRFPGSEIWRDPTGCADDVAALVSQRRAINGGK